MYLEPLLFHLPFSSFFYLFLPFSSFFFLFLPFSSFFFLFLPFPTFFFLLLLILPLSPIIYFYLYLPLFPLLLLDIPLPLPPPLSSLLFSFFLSPHSSPLLQLPLLYFFRRPLKAVTPSFPILHSTLTPSSFLPSPPLPSLSPPPLFPHLTPFKRNEDAYLHSWHKDTELAICNRAHHCMKFVKMASQCNDLLAGKARSHLQASSCIPPDVL